MAAVNRKYPACDAAGAVIGALQIPLSKDPPDGPPLAMRDQHGSTWVLREWRNVTGNPYFYERAECVDATLMVRE